MQGKYDDALPPPSLDLNAAAADPYLDAATGARYEPKGTTAPATHRGVPALDLEYMERRIAEALADF